MDQNFGTRGMFLHTVTFDMINSLLHMQKQYLGCTLEDKKLILLCATDTCSVCLWGFLSVCRRWLILTHSLPSCCMDSWPDMHLLGVMWSCRLHSCRQWPSSSSSCSTSTNSSISSSSSTSSICRRRSNGRYSTAASYKFYLSCEVYLSYSIIVTVD